MPNWAQLAVAEAKRGFLLRIRYPVALLGGALSVLLIYGVIQLTSTLLAGNAPVTPGMAHAAVNYRLFASVALWSLIVGSLWSLAQMVEEETQNGALEYCFISTVSTTGIFSIRFLCASSYTFMVLLMMIFGAFRANGQGGIPFTSLVAIMVCLHASVFGLAMILAGLMLRFKKLGLVLPAIFLLAFLVVVLAYARRLDGMLPAFLPIYGPIDALINYPKPGANSAWAILPVISGAMALLGVMSFASACKKCLQSGSTFFR
jgi:hypothetical protein